MQCGRRVDTNDNEDNTILHFVSRDTDAFGDHYVRLFELAESAQAHITTKLGRVDPSLLGLSPFASKINTKNKVRCSACSRCCSCR